MGVCVHVCIWIKKMEYNMYIYIYIINTCHVVFLTAA